MGAGFRTGLCDNVWHWLSVLGWVLLSASALIECLVPDHPDGLIFGRRDLRFICYKVAYCLFAIGRILWAIALVILRRRQFCNSQIWGMDLRHQAIVLLTLQTLMCGAEAYYAVCIMTSNVPKDRFFIWKVCEGMLYTLCSPVKIAAFLPVWGFRQTVIHRISELMDQPSQLDEWVNSFPARYHQVTESIAAIYKECSLAMMFLLGGNICNLLGSTINYWRYILEREEFWKRGLYLPYFSFILAVTCSMQFFVLSTVKWQHDKLLGHVRSVLRDATDKGINCTSLAMICQCMKLDPLCWDLYLSRTSVRPLLRLRVSLGYKLTITMLANFALKPLANLFFCR